MTEKTGDPVHRFIAPAALIGVPDRSEWRTLMNPGHPLLYNDPAPVMKHAETAFQSAGAITGAAILDGVLLLSGRLTDDDDAQRLRSGDAFLSLDVRTRGDWESSEDAAGNPKLVARDWQVRGAMLADAKHMCWDLPRAMVWAV